MEDAFQAFLAEADATLTPSAFLYWMQDNSPFLVGQMALRK